MTHLIWAVKKVIAKPDYKRPSVDFDVQFYETVSEAKKEFDTIANIFVKDNSHICYKKFISDDYFDDYYSESGMSNLPIDLELWRINGSVVTSLLKHEDYFKKLHSANCECDNCEEAKVIAKPKRNRKK